MHSFKLLLSVKETDSRGVGQHCVNLGYSVHSKVFTIVELLISIHILNLIKCDAYSSYTPDEICLQILVPLLGY